MNIFVIDKVSKRNLAIIDFTPKKEDRIHLVDSFGREIECIVECLLFEPKERNILIFVSVVEPYYSAMVKEIVWQ